MAFDGDYETLGELGQGGMAVVYKARRRRDSRLVAVKRPRSFPHCDERLKREVDVLSKLDHPHLMPVLGYGVDDDKKWFYAMPVARGSLKSLWESGVLGADVDAVAAEVLEQVCLGLQAMHDADYLHRDVKPANVVALDDESYPNGYRWVVADCGLVRRPLGETTYGLTGSASRLGTDGYIAPEGFGDPHNVTKAADVYSVGRIIAWLVTGESPVLIRPLLPEGSWRPVVRAFTYDDPDRRPQSMTEALERTASLRVELPTSEKAEFRTEVRDRGGNLRLDNPLWEVALENIDDHAFMVDDVIEIEHDAVMRFATSRPGDAARLAERMARHLIDGEWGHRNYDHANTVLDWILAVIKGLDKAAQYGPVEDVAVAYCEAASSWNRFSHNDRVSRWLTELRGKGADAMARAIHQTGETQFFRDITRQQRFASPALTGLLEA